MRKAVRRSSASGQPGRSLVSAGRLVASASDMPSLVLAAAWGHFISMKAVTNSRTVRASLAGDQRVTSYVLMRKSAIAIESGDHGHGLGLANAALSNADALTSRLRAVILRTRAIANAYLGEAADSARD
ncbi:hypothetical protein ABZ470_19585 [Streptosporangium sp. NPDC020072]|uniref:hypothetical protein n=1 Tax=Streptosporangium sp. NPDC020072 TaxID=3154788 RepID=UPI00341CD5EA